MLTDERKAALLAAIDEAVKVPGKEWSAPSPLGVLAVAAGLPEWVLARWEDHEAIGGGPGESPRVVELWNSARLPAVFYEYTPPFMQAVQDAWRSSDDVSKARGACRRVVNEYEWPAEQVTDPEVHLLVEPTPEPGA